MGKPEIHAFLTFLAVRRKVSASTQNQALSALVFLYREVLQNPFEWLDELERAKRPHRIPVVLSREEVRAILSQLEGTYWLMSALLYGSGERIMECIRLRVKDVDFEYRQIIIRDGKGQKDRVTILPGNLIEPLRNHLARVKRLHESDLKQGYGQVYLPVGLIQKYPSANRDWAWQYMFAAAKLSIDPRTETLSAITSANKPCSARCGKQSEPPLFPNQPRVIRSDIVLQLIFWKAVMISVPFENCSGTKICLRR